MHTTALKDLMQGAWPAPSHPHVKDAQRAEAALEILSEAGELLLLFPVSERSNRLDFQALFTANQTNI